jgi:hypothetical protein
MQRQRAAVHILKVKLEMQFPTRQRMNYLYDTFGRLSLVQANIVKESLVTLGPLCVSVAGEGFHFPRTSELIWYSCEARRTEAGENSFPKLKRPRSSTLGRQGAY